MCDEEKGVECIMTSPRGILFQGWHACYRTSRENRGELLSPVEEDIDISEAGYISGHCVRA